MLIDTHVHFDEFLAGGEEEAVLERAVLAGVERMVAVGGSRESNCMAVDMARAHPDRIRAAIGYARDQAQSDCPAGDLEKLLGESAAAAIGETGLVGAINAAPCAIRCSIQCWTAARDCRYWCIAASRGCRG